MILSGSLINWLNTRADVQPSCSTESYVTVTRINTQSRLLSNHLIQVPGSPIDVYRVTFGECLKEIITGQVCKTFTLNVWLTVLQQWRHVIVKYNTHTLGFFIWSVSVDITDYAEISSDPHGKPLWDWRDSFTGLIPHPTCQNIEGNSWT